MGRFVLRLIAYGLLRVWGLGLSRTVLFHCMVTLFGLGFRV